MLYYILMLVAMAYPPAAVLRVLRAGGRVRYLLRMQQQLVAWRCDLQHG